MKPEISSAASNNNFLRRPLNLQSNEFPTLREKMDHLYEWTKQEAQIKLNAANYQLACELYDLTLPGYTSKHGEWIPRGEYLSDSSRYANKARKYWIEGLSANDKKKFQHYLGEYARYSVEELKRVVEDLINFICAK